MEESSNTSEDSTGQISQFVTMETVSNMGLNSLTDPSVPTQSNQTLPSQTLDSSSLEQFSLNESPHSFLALPVNFDGQNCDQLQFQLHSPIPNITALVLPSGAASVGAVDPLTTNSVGDQFPIPIPLDILSSNFPSAPNTAQEAIISELATSNNVNGSSADGGSQSASNSAGGEGSSAEGDDSDEGAGEGELSFADVDGEAEGTFADVDMFGEGPAQPPLVSADPDGDSLSCSWLSDADNDAACQNWRGWKAPSTLTTRPKLFTSRKCVNSNFSFRCRFFYYSNNTYSQYHLMLTHKFAYIFFMYFSSREFA